MNVFLKIPYSVTVGTVLFVTFSEHYPCHGRAYSRKMWSLPDSSLRCEKQKPRIEYEPEGARFDFGRFLYENDLSEREKRSRKSLFSPRSYSHPWCFSSARSHAGRNHILREARLMAYQSISKM
jgi:hypothetical protein